jgi:hypothetical protein
MKRTFTVMTLVMALLISTMSMAFAWTVTDDYTGDVGKGQVQDALDWNNADFQDYAEHLAFRHVQRDHYRLLCQLEGTVMFREVFRQEITNTFLDYDLRANRQGMFTGIDFTQQLSQHVNDNMTCPTGYVLYTARGEENPTYLHTTYELHVRHVVPGAGNPWVEILMAE